jgi:hypothetical protein
MTLFETLRQLFASLVPELQRLAAVHFRHLDPECQAEAVQNSLALAWQGAVAVARQGQAVEPGLLKSALWYAVRQTKCGRRVEGESRAEDVYKYARKGRVRFQRLELQQFVADTTPIPEQVSFRVDVPAFLGTLTSRQRDLAADLMGGLTTTECADKYGVTLGRISQFRSLFRERFEQFMAG